MVRAIECYVALEDRFFVASLYDFWGMPDNGRSELDV